VAVPATHLGVFERYSRYRTTHRLSWEQIGIFFGCGCGISAIAFADYHLLPPAVPQDLLYCQ